MSSRQSPFVIARGQFSCFSRKLVLTISALLLLVLMDGCGGKRMVAELPWIGLVTKGDHVYASIDVKKYSPIILNSCSENMMVGPVFRFDGLIQKAFREAQHPKYLSDVVITQENKFSLGTVHGCMVLSGNVPMR